jgi:hypothetical protein
MRITIDTPDIACSRCSETAAIIPRTLHLAHPGTPQFEASTIDSLGNVWIVEAESRPPGWTAGPSDGANLSRGLCPACSTALDAAMQSFMAGGSLEMLPPAAAVPAAPPASPAPAPAASASPIRYIDRPPTAAIPAVVTHSPTRTTLVNHVVASRPSAVSPIPPPAPMNSRTAIASAQMVVNTTKVSTNTLPPQRYQEIPVQKLEQVRGLVQVAGVPAAPVRFELPAQSGAVVEVGEAEPTPSLAPEQSKVTY